MKKNLFRTTFLRKTLTKKSIYEKRRKLNQKGISPLIATVLLIGFTVALAALVMTWGSGFIKKITTETSENTDLALKCANLDFEITNVNCGNGKVSVTNGARVPIKAIKFRLTTDSGVTVHDYKTAIGILEAPTITFNSLEPSASLSSSVKSIKAFPIIQGVEGGEDFPCGEEAAQEYLNPCSP